MKNTLNSQLPWARLALGGLFIAVGIVVMAVFSMPGHGGGALGMAETASYEGGYGGYATPLLVLGFILLFSWLPARAAKNPDNGHPAIGYYQAANYTIHFWAVFMTTASLIATTFLQGLSDAQGWTGVIDPDFPRVVINDLQENSQFALILLCIYYGLSLFNALRSRLMVQRA